MSGASSSTRAALCARHPRRSSAGRERWRRVTTAGIVGGLGPESTVDYYRRILAAWAVADPYTAPSIVIDSLDVWRALRLVDTDRAALTDYLLGSVHRLAAAGADFVAMTANTPHIVFDEVSARSPVPLLSIVEVCAAEAQRRGLRRPALLGTRFTMDAPFFADVLARFGIAVVLPGEAERAWIHEAYVGELLRGEFREETRQRFQSIVARMRADEGIDAVILGGTELPLLLDTASIAGLPALDTTALHVSAIVERLRTLASSPPRQEIQPDRNSEAADGQTADRGGRGAPRRRGAGHRLEER